MFEGMKSRLNMGNACYHSVQNNLPSRLLSTILKIKIFTTTFLNPLLYMSVKPGFPPSGKNKDWGCWGQSAQEDFALNREKAMSEWRKLHNEVLSKLYFSLNIIWVIRSRMMRWAEHVAHSM